MLCSTEKASFEICTDERFWKGLIRCRYSHYKGDIIINPKRLFYQLSTTLYHITMKIFAKHDTSTIPFQEISFITGKQEIIAATIIAADTYLSQLSIIKPDLSLLTYDEAQGLARIYRPRHQNLFAIHYWHPNLMTTEVTYKYYSFLKTLYLVNVTPIFLEHLVKLLTWLGAKDITISQKEPVNDMA